MCCGKNRMGSSQTKTSPPSRGAQATTTPGSRQRSSVAYFQYSGNTAMTVIGPISKMRYRFPSPGSRLPVDIRDRAALAAVPGLVQVQGL